MFTKFHDFQWLINFQKIPETYTKFPDFPGSVWTLHDIWNCYFVNTLYIHKYFYHIGIRVRILYQLIYLMHQNKLTMDLVSIWICVNQRKQLKTRSSNKSNASTSNILIFCIICKRKIIIYRVIANDDLTKATKKLQYKGKMKNRKKRLDHKSKD